jgi:hypothetical protein
MQKQFRHIFISAATFCFASVTDLAAQDSNRVQKPVFLHTSFYFDFPKSVGAAAGIDFPFSSKIKISSSKDGTKKIRYRDWILNADIGFYRYRFNNTGVFFIPSAGKRYSGEHPYYFEWLAGAGVVRTFYDGIVYSVDDNGKVQEKSYFGRWYATANIATTFGWNLAKAKNAKPVALQVKPVLWFQFPYNSFMLPHLSVEAGIKYHFKNFNTKIQQHKGN